MICVVIPAFNEAVGLADLLPRMPRRLRGHEVLVIVADDGSADDTAGIAATLGHQVVSAPVNRGKGAALRLGLDRASEFQWDALVLMDGDGQHDPADLGSLVGPILDGAADVVAANRYGGAPQRGRVPWNRFLVRRLTTTVLRVLTGEDIADPYCGFKAFSPRAMAALDLRGDRYESELEILFDCVDHRMRVAETPIERVYGPGMSKMGHRRGAFLGRVAVLWQYASTIARRGFTTARHRQRTTVDA